MEMNSTNLQRLRVNAQKTLKEVALATGISAATISKYENNLSQPIPENLATLADYFGVSANFFGAKTAETQELKYRKFAARQKKSLSADEAAAQLFAHVVNEFEEVIFLPECTLPRIDCGPNTSFEVIDEAARTVRDHLIGHNEPIHHLFRAIEEAGAICIVREKEVTSDGWSTWIQDREPLGARPIITIFTSNPQSLTPRERLSLAHELGHLVMHRDLMPANGDEHKKMETAAYRFASVFLMPTVDPAWAHLSLSKLLNVKMRYGMSVQAIIRRLWDDGLISKDRYTKLSIDLSRRGWRRVEPFDGAFVEDSPSLLRELHEWAVDERLSPDWLVAKSGLSVDVVAGVLTVSPEELKPRSRFQARFRRDM